MSISCTTLSYGQLEEIKKLADRFAGLGVSFAAFSHDGQEIVSHINTGKSDFEEMRSQAMISLSDFGAKNDCSQSDFYLLRVLKVARKPLAIIIIDIKNCKYSDTGFSAADLFSQILDIFAEKFAALEKTENQILDVSGELSLAYEELVLLHKLSMNMRVTEKNGNFLQLACDSLTDIVLVEGIAILVDDIGNDNRRWRLAAGSGLFDADENMTSMIYSRLITELAAGKEALIDSDIDTPFKYDWPTGINSIIAVPLCGKERRDDGSLNSIERSVLGVMVAINRIQKSDFDSTDIKLFDSVANSCAVFIENGRLFTDLKELFIGSLKALTSSIDAKDQYTRGHSERVAYISKWLVEKYAAVEPLSEQDIQKVYLAGLLHDIGKMGINESVLRKEGKLTNDEFSHIRMHPLIGSQILSGIKQMRDIVSGVLCHHERYDGKGYPHGLVGEQIPLFGRIICLADSFDAMTSRRVYRDALTVDNALDQIRKGLSTQFDPKLGSLFLESDIDELWEIMQQGYNSVYGFHEFSEYGAMAVGALIR